MNNLKHLREEKDLLEKDIAKIINISQTNYSKYELGKINIPTDTLIRLALFYNTSVDYILGLTRIKNPSEREKISN
jgi:transcriptional regulator with XRE-family HTH domain